MDYARSFLFLDVPTYEYKCPQDGSTFELWQEVGAPAPACPDCGAPTKKVFHPTRTIFKGAGFYVTDLRAESQSAKSSGDKNGDKTEAKSDAPTETKSDASGESRGETKSEAAPAKATSDASVAKPEAGEASSTSS